MCLELTVYSGQRQAHTSIGRAKYRVVNGPIFAGKMAVKSCTMYNTTPPVGSDRNTLRIRQYGGPGDAAGIVEVSVDPGQYSGEELAQQIQDLLVFTLTQNTPDAECITLYNPITRRIAFAFDQIYSYEYAETYAQYEMRSPGGLLYIPWQYIDSAGVQHVANTQLAASGTFLVDDWLHYVSETFTAAAQIFETPIGQTADIVFSINPLTLQVSILTTLPGALFQIVGTDSIPQMSLLGIDGQGMTGAISNSFTSSIPYPYSGVGQPIANPMEKVLNFSVDGDAVSPRSWRSGQLNLSGPLYMHFRSRILANRNHRTADDSRDTTFFSMPKTSAYTQLQYYEPNERVWIEFKGGIELTDFEVDLYDENDNRIEPTQDYVLELLIQQTEVF